MLKMDSFCIGHKAWLLFCYLRHILLQNVVTNIDKFKKTVKFCESPDYHRSELAQLHSPMFPDEICSELQQKQPISQ